MSEGNQKWKLGKPSQAEDKQQTKQRILEAALHLFSIHGFSNVSVRELGKAVGIKESSIYYHFDNKEHILETILANVTELIHAQKGQFMHALKVTASVQREQFIATGLYYVEHILLDEHMYKLIRMLSIEKQRNKQAAEMYVRLLFQWPLEHQEQVFTYMMEAGIIKQDSAKELAAEYQAIILFVFQKYFSGAGEWKLTFNEAARGELEQLLARFYNRSLKGDVQ